MKSRLVLTLVLVFSLQHQVQPDALIKTTDAGTKYVGVGYTMEFDNTEYTLAKFRGIPFAKPPTGNLRFAKPQAPVVGEQYDAREFKSVCMQPPKPLDACLIHQPIDEDCLYLNVYVPLPGWTASDVNDTAIDSHKVLADAMSSAKSLPDGASHAVFVYVYGGAWLEGNGNCYDGSVLAGLGEVIVVTFNYRLGLLGFATTEDDVIPGNAGLWDQVFALKWVKDNIEKFGGDVSKITVGGNSAGSMNILVHSLFQEDEQLFHRVLAMSGDASFNKVTSTVGYKSTLTAAKALGCSPQPSKQELKTCLLNLNQTDFVGLLPPSEMSFGLPFLPTLEAPLIPLHPSSVLSGSYDPSKMAVLSRFAKKDILTGIVSEDGEVMYQIWRILTQAPTNSTYITLDYIKTMIFQLLASRYDEDIDTYKYVIEAAVDRYLDWANINDDVKRSREAITIITDMCFVLPMISTLNTHIATQEALTLSPGGHRYVYRFKTPKTSLLYQTYVFSWFEGTHHDADIPYVFGGINQSEPEDVQLSKALMTYWTSFIKTGSPNPSTNSLNLPQWDQYTSTNKNILELKTTPEQTTHFAEDAVHFWWDYLPGVKQRLCSQGVRSTSVSLAVVFTLPLSLVSRFV
ncbi:acetylcholinesterase-like [Physella acuta]|uniref:acetylcholinesterase-like n=1 Tax=Physella acuta TaxID=109671 RepID=UPI0027DB05D2|nr:acetylcholinesterase-like [Physella acuta]